MRLWSDGEVFDKVRHLCVPVLIWSERDDLSLSPISHFVRVHIELWASQTDWRLQEHQLRQNKYFRILQGYFYFCKSHLKIHVLTPRALSKVYFQISTVCIRIKNEICWFVSLFLSFLFDIYPTLTFRYPIYYYECTNTISAYYICKTIKSEVLAPSTEYTDSISMWVYSLSFWYIWNQNVANTGQKA